jgi:hypothetical protein
VVRVNAHDLLAEQIGLAAPQVDALLDDQDIDAGHLIEYAARWAAALRVVLDLHREHESGDGTCVGCSERAETYDDIPWPCPAVTAIMTALEGP